MLPSVRAKKWREENKERVIAYNRLQRIDDPVQVVGNILFRNAKGRANRLHREFSLSLDWVFEKLRAGRCEVTGLPFDLVLAARGDRKHSPWSPSIHRINSNSGYVDGNIQMVVLLYNTARSNATDEEFYLLIDAIQARRQNGK